VGVEGRGAKACLHGGSHPLKKTPDGKVLHALIRRVAEPASHIHRLMVPGQPKGILLNAKDHSMRPKEG
jgi:hypothetical protein